MRSVNCLLPSLSMSGPLSLIAADCLDAFVVRGLGLRDHDSVSAWLLPNEEHSVKRLGFALGSTGNSFQKSPRNHRLRFPLFEELFGILLP